MKYRRIILLPLVFVLACAAKSTIYVPAAKITLTASKALQFASTSADSAYANQLLTGVQLNHIRGVLLPAATATQSAENVLLVWTEDSAPPQLHAMLDAIQAAIADLTAFLPESSTKSIILTHLETARTLAELLLSNFISATKSTIYVPAAKITLTAS